MPLSNRKVFIGGPIQYAIHREGFHDELKQTIELAIDTVSALNGQVLSAHLAERFGCDTPSFTPEIVSRRDFAWMQQSDVFMPVMPITEDKELMRTDGTHIELGWASALKRPVLLVTELPIVESGSHLLKGLECICKLFKLDLKEFRKAPMQIGEILNDLMLMRIPAMDRPESLLTARDTLASG